MPALLCTPWVILSTFSRVSLSSCALADAPFMVCREGLRVLFDGTSRALPVEVVEPEAELHKMAESSLDHSAWAPH